MAIKTTGLNIKNPKCHSFNFKVEIGYWDIANKYAPIQKPCYRNEGELAMMILQVTDCASIDDFVAIRI